MEVLITILIVLACVLLSAVILIQNPKEGGLDSSFASANKIGGVKRTADFLEKATWTLAIVIVGLSLLTAMFKEAPQVQNTGEEEINPAAPATEAPQQ